MISNGLIGRQGVTKSLTAKCFEYPFVGERWLLNGPDYLRKFALYVRRLHNERRTWLQSIDDTAQVLNELKDLHLDDIHVALSKSNSTDFDPLMSIGGTAEGMFRMCTFVLFISMVYIYFCFCM